MKTRLVLEFDSDGLVGATGQAKLAANIIGARIVRLTMVGKARELAESCPACGEIHAGRCLESIG